MSNIDPKNVDDAISKLETVANIDTYKLMEAIEKLDAVSRIDPKKLNAAIQEYLKSDGRDRSTAAP